ncbi:M20 aminoacylase family protein [Roseomonas marmotae]|uniref:Amidohydrolase n=1 Tax=Roseomonas marmotae TaxID=2768161 RepID=A0ABS3KH00_9PROT|nr:M20 aminoacylase family protein [Roseomonas marmotae]MBO1076262.1 amidohydrolase [Roseomonas marmotae]QTI77855.1 amidohydrolase [Roseomonas marmotae]
MSVIDHIRRYQDDLTAIRHDFHIHPELGMEEHRTAGIVAKKLESWGIEVHRGVGRTGVVGVLRSGKGNRAVGLRADMDALPMTEKTGLPYASQTPGKMHACGHDGHTTMLLGAARYLAETRNFDGTVHFIFQPGEEGCGGALAMLEDGLFERFPCDAIFGMHNRPGMPVGEYGIRPGPTAAGGAFFDITVRGKGAHGARPEVSQDPVLAACQIATATQSIVARNISPFEPAVISITKVQGGDAYNVIPDTAVLSGTARFFSREVAQQIEAGLKRVAEGVAAGMGCEAELDFRLIFAPTVNDPELTTAYADAAASLVGEGQVARNKEPGMGSEDFSFMMEKVPGAYIHVGNGPGATPHNPAYNFNDEATPYGAGLYARIVETMLPKG